MEEKERGATPWPGVGVGTHDALEAVEEGVGELQLKREGWALLISLPRPLGLLANAGSSWARSADACGRAEGRSTFEEADEAVWVVQMSELQAVVYMLWWLGGELAFVLALALTLTLTLVLWS